MVDHGAVELEKAKIKAAYWNHIALAVFVAGALPLLVSVEPITKASIEAAMQPEFWAQSTLIIPAWILSWMIHGVAKRSFDHLS